MAENQPTAEKHRRNDEVDGWLAALSLQFQYINDKTCMLPQRRLGPLTVQRPFYPEGDVCHAYVLHPPGGVVGGDQLQLELDVRAGAHALVTTPGAGKFYRSAGKIAILKQDLKVSSEAVLEFLPQESIYFPASQLSSMLHINVAKNAKFAGWEIHCFGLPANDKDFNEGRVQLNTELKVDGRLLMHDRLNIDSFERGRTSGLQGHRVFGSFVIYSQAIDKSLLDVLQAAQPDSGISGVSRVEDALIVVRYLGNSTEHAHSYFRSLWQKSRPAALGRDACEPRIWNT